MGPPFCMSAVQRDLGTVLVWILVLSESEFVNSKSKKNAT